MSGRRSYPLREVVSTLATKDVGEGVKVDAVELECGHLVSKRRWRAHGGPSRMRCSYCHLADLREQP